MSVRLDNVADYLKILATADITQLAWCVWVKNKVDRNDFASVFYHTGQTQGWYQTDSDGVTFKAYHDDANPQTGPVLTVDVWKFLAFRGTATARALLYGDEAGGTLTKVTGSTTITIPAGTSDLVWGNDYQNEWGNLELAYGRVWTGAQPSDADFDAEWRSATAVRTSNLFADWAFANAATAATDSSGNGRTLTVGGTLTDGGANPTLPALGKAIVIPRRRLLRNMIARF